MSSQMERLLQQSTLRPVAISEISLRSPKNIRNNIYNFLSAFTRLAYPGCPGKEAVKWLLLLLLYQRLKNMPLFFIVCGDTGQKLTLLLTLLAFSMPDESNPTGKSSRPSMQKLQSL